MDSEPLLQLARSLAAGTRNTQGRPSQAELKTAVNRTYYALFHTLANTAADAAVGRNARANREPAWLQTARALNHRTAKSECRKIWKRNLLTLGARRFAETFDTAQTLRHEADYNDFYRFTRSQVITLIEQSEEAINALNAETTLTKRSLAAMAMHQSR